MCSFFSHIRRFNFPFSCYEFWPIYPNV